MFEIANDKYEEFMKESRKGGLKEALKRIEDRKKIKMEDKMKRYLWQYEIDRTKSAFDTKNRDYDRLLEDFNGTKVLSTSENDSKYKNGNYIFPKGEYNVSIDESSGVKRLRLEGGADEPGYYIFICYFI